MLRSMYAGVTGLKAHQIAMDVIGNNISNINTIGFKAARATFEDIFSQTLSPASLTVTGRSVKNPAQIGLGVKVGSVENIFTQGGIQTTENPLDLSIQGNGFFVVTDGMRDFYTRAGNFSFDSKGNLVNPEGFIVKGYTTYLPDGETIDTTGVPTEINIKDKMTLPAKATDKVSVGANLNASASIGSTHTLSIDIYDSLGEKTTLTITFKKIAENQWSWTPTVSVGTVSGGGVLYFTQDGALSLSYTDPTIIFNPATGAKLNQTIVIDFGTAGKCDGVTQFAIPNVSISSTNFLYQNGYTTGNLESFFISNTGIIIGTYSNGIQRNLAQIVLANFINPQGLLKRGGNLYEETINSGKPIVGLAGTGGRGTILSGSLEMSNVDLAREFTNMIIIERGFQANSRIITVGDELLREIISLKR